MSWKSFKIENPDDLKQMNNLKHFISEFEFFLNTEKKVVTSPLGAILCIEGVEEILNEYPSIFEDINGNFTKDIEQAVEIVVAKDVDALITYMATFDEEFPYDELVVRGLLFGYPKTAIQDFIRIRETRDILNPNKKSANVKGLQFVFYDQNREVIKEEFKKMYGFDMEDNYIE